MRQFFLVFLFFTSFSYAYDLKVFEITDKIPHDKDYNFTEGLFVDEGKLYESTGTMEASGIVVYDLKTKKVLKKLRTPGFFGEGSAVLDGVLYQLSWKEGVVHLYDIKTLEMRRGETLFVPTEEGWGLASAGGGKFWLSDGTSRLHLINAKTFDIDEAHKIVVDNNPLFNINELEVVDGLVYMNVWFDHFIYVYDPKKKEVVLRIETDKVHQEERQAILSDRNNVINGIAYDEATKTLYITGKRWKYIYAGKLVDPPR